jgi:hypothetical protein
MRSTHELEVQPPRRVDHHGADAGACGRVGGVRVPEPGVLDVDRAGGGHDLPLARDRLLLVDA